MCWDVRRRQKSNGNINPPSVLRGQELIRLNWSKHEFFLMCKERYINSHMSCNIKHPTAGICRVQQINKSRFSENFKQKCAQWYNLRHNYKYVCWSFTSLKGRFNKQVLSSEKKKSSVTTNIDYTDPRYVLPINYELLLLRIESKVI